MDSEALLADLDEAQRLAVSQPQTPLAVLAPAGSGKTRVLTRRVAYQAAEGVIDPRRVLCVAFTREAAGELRARLRSLGLRDLPAAGTFHGIASAQLRVRWEDRRERPPELITDRVGALRRLLPQRLAPAAPRLEAEIGWAKSRGIAPEDYVLAARETRRRPPGGQAEAARWYDAYEGWRHKAAAMDFDDLLSLAIAAFEHDELFARAQRFRFRHLLVDEFQDVNPLQFRLLRAWLGSSLDLVAVGDPQQAIYGWNGADAAYLQRFKQHFPTANVVELTTNYRSRAPIVALAAAVSGLDAPAAPAGDGVLPALTEYADALAELNAVADTCRSLAASGLSWNNQAVLVRTNVLARQVAAHLSDRGVPCRLLTRHDGGPLAETVERLARAANTFAELTADLAEEARGPDSPVQLRRLAERCADFAALDPVPTPRRFVEWLRLGGFMEEGRGVSVATFHAAKGLEWQAVQVIALEAGFMPVAAAGTPAALAEERRLLYVALTRATEVLFCSWARRRADGKGVMQERERSPYLDAVDVRRRQLAAAAQPAGPPDHLRQACRRSLASVPPPAGQPAELLAEAVAALRRWRAQQARAAAVSAQAVLDDDTLARVAVAQPADAEQLAAVVGMGPLRSRRLAAGILAALGKPAPARLSLVGQPPKSR